MSHLGLGSSVFCMSHFQFQVTALRDLPTPGDSDSTMSDEGRALMEGALM